MKCPNCGDPKLAYTVSHSKRSHSDRLAGKKGEGRTDFHTECKKCGFKGEVGQPEISQFLTTPFNTVPEDKEELE